MRAGCLVFNGLLSNPLRSVPDLPRNRGRLIAETWLSVALRAQQAAEKIDESASFEQGGAALQRVQRLYFDGDMDASVANTGQVAGRIEDIPPAADIIKQMWAGCREVLAATADRLGPSSDGS
jgi:NAD(P)H-dependent flavin oxidoreductase YrpB (nitropropane dioxygenase family)